MHTPALMNARSFPSQIRCMSGFNFISLRAKHGAHTCKNALMRYMRSKTPEFVTFSQAVLQKYQCHLQKRGNLCPHIHFYALKATRLSACAYSVEHFDPDFCRWSVTRDLCGAGRASARFSPYRARNCVILGLIMTPEPFYIHFFLISFHFVEPVTHKPG